MYSLLPYLLCLAAYLSGSIPFGKIIGKVHGIDIQKRGSGNIGFANVRRVLGWGSGLATLFADIVKGFIPTLLALHIYGENAAFITGVLAILGHVFPVWLQFRGGKGIATGLGVVLVIQPIAGLTGVAVYLSGCLILKNSGMSSIIGVVCLVVTGSLLQHGIWWQYGILFVIAVWTLRKNILGTVANYDI